jgi:hypothetical protein
MKKYLCKGCKRENIKSAICLHCKRYTNSDAQTDKYLVDEEKVVTDWDVFEDRTESLIKRWKNFVKKNPEKSKEAIQGFLLEVNDGFTSKLLNK